MANIPNIFYTLPFKKTYRCDIAKDGIVVLETDNLGYLFNVVGDKYSAASRLLERSLELKSFIKEDRCDLAESAIGFHYRDNKLVDVSLRYSKEDRPEVFEIIAILKSMISLKAYW